MDLNHRPDAYQASALTNCAIVPKLVPLEGLEPPTSTSVELRSNPLN